MANQSISSTEDEVNISISETFNGQDNLDKHTRSTMANGMLSVPEMLRRQSEVTGDGNAFSFYDQHGLVSILKASDIYTLSGKFASLLSKQGFKSGDVIANGLPNSPERVITDFGIMMAGCVTTNCLVTERDGSDFWKMARISDCRAVLISSRAEDHIHQLFSTFLNNTVCDSHFHDLSIPQTPNLRTIIICNRAEDDERESFLETLRVSNEDIFEAECIPSDLAVLFKTSGCSGYCKLVPATHGDVFITGTTARSSRTTPYYSDRPFGWNGGFPYEFLAHGTHRILQDQFNDEQVTSPPGLWEIISSTKCVSAAFLPKSIYELLDHFEEKPPDYKLFHIGTGGQPIKKRLMKAIGLLCHALVVVYGSSEACVISIGIVRNPDSFENFYCGKVKENLEIKIVDETGSEVNQGEEGEIWIKGVHVFKRYYNQELLGFHLNDVMQDGWFKTKDMGLLHADGSLYCLGRKKESLLIGNTRLYLHQLESILSECSLLRDVSIAVIGKDDSVINLCAFVVPLARENFLTNSVIEFFERETLDMELCKIKLKLSHIIVLDKFPTLPSGKTNKWELNRLVQDELNLSII